MNNAYSAVAYICVSSIPQRIITKALQYREYILRELQSLKNVDRRCIFYTHYSKSQIFVRIFHLDKNPNIFTSFSPNFFLTIFLVKSKLPTAKKSKTTTFSRVFQTKNRQLSRKSKLNFWTKNEDFEQCELRGNKE